jgi:CRP/FNR family transcriptional regulator, cyclic AMP receptor protein
VARRKDPKLTALQTVPLFKDLSKKDLAAVSRIADEIDFSAGRELIREDTTGTQFFVLLEGEAEVRRRGRKVNKLGPGDFFGEIALLTDHATTATVTTSTAVTVVVITRTNFKRLLREAPNAQWDVLQALAKRVPTDDFRSAG